MDTECPKHREKFASFDKLYDAAVFLSNFLHKIILEVQSILEGVQHYFCALSWPECCTNRIQHQQGIIGWKFARKIVSATKSGIGPHQL